MSNKYSSNYNYDDDFSLDEYREKPRAKSSAVKKDMIAVMQAAKTAAMKPCSDDTPVEKAYARSSWATLADF